MHNHHYNHYNHHHHHEPPHAPPRLKPNNHPHHSSHELSPETPVRNDHDADAADAGGGGGGAMILSEKYYSPLMSPSDSSSYTSPTSTMHMHNMHVPPRDDFPPPKLSSLQSHHFLSFKETQELSPSPPSNTIDHQCSPALALPPPPRPPAPPPRMGIIYGGGGGGERNKRKEGVEHEKTDVGSNVNMDRGLFKVSKVRMGWLKKVGMVLRVLELVFCVISFSVMGSDKTQGWSGDSFDRYKEYRFCFTVNILGFAYAGVQVLKLGLYCIGGNQCIIKHHLCCKFDFFMDQIISYLLVAASTAGATRAADWEANWGKDEFTRKASMSVSMAFLAFIAFACNSLISGYTIFNS